MPVAVYASDVPRASVVLNGATSMRTSVACVTVSVVEPVSPLSGSVAVIIAVPVFGVCVNPLVMLICATDVFDELHVTPGSAYMLPSLYMPVAVNVRVVRRETVG